MLTIAKLRVGPEAYQVSGVAQSLDDYYTGVGEAAGRWIGTGAERHGLCGDVAASGRSERDATAGQNAPGCRDPCLGAGAVKAPVVGEGG